LSLLKVLQALYQYKFKVLTIWKNQGIRTSLLLQQFSKVEPGYYVLMRLIVKKNPTIQIQGVSLQQQVIDELVNGTGIYKTKKRIQMESSTSGTFFLPLEWKQLKKTQKQANKFRLYFLRVLTNATNLGWKQLFRYENGIIFFCSHRKRGIAIPQPSPTLQKYKLNSKQNRKGKKKRAE